MNGITIPCQQDLKITTHSHENAPSEAEVRHMLGEPILKNGAIITHLMNHRLSSERIKSVHELIMAVNPTYPGDGMDALTVANLLMGFVMISPEEIDILKKLLFDEGGQTRTNLVANKASTILTFHYAFKRIAKSYSVSFSSENDPRDSISMLSFPITVSIQAWANMDDLSNHGDDCPQALEESDSCDCGPELLNEVRTSLGDSSEESMDRIRKWIAHEVFVGESEEEEED